MRTAEKALAMVNGDFLESYTTIEGLTFTLNRLERRLKFHSNLAFAVLDLKENLNQFTASFNLFFPEILEMTKHFILEDTKGH
jgi:acyl carrier protein phosphodiesterase